MFLELRTMTTITVLYGNNNSYNIDIPSTTKIGHLAGIIPVLLYKKSTDVLFMIINGHIAGQRDYDFDKAMNDCGFVNNKCNVYLILKDPDRTYSESELRYSSRNMTWLKNAASSINTGTFSAQQFIDAFGLGFGNLDFNTLEDEIVTIPEDQYHLYVTPTDVDTDTTCTICQEDIAEAVTLYCGHSFHDNCIRGWLTTSSVKCPTCNHDVRDNT